MDQPAGGWGAGMMFTVSLSFYFLGLAVCILAASVCLSKGKRASRRVEVDLDVVRAVSVCLPTQRWAAVDGTREKIYKELLWDKKATWTNMKAMWMQWYSLCQEKAVLKQKAMYSWTRTMALCAVLCLIGVLLQAEFDQPITIGTILAGFRRPDTVASRVPTAQLHLLQTKEKE
jgi:hypothetical protein